MRDEQGRFVKGHPPLRAKPGVLCGRPRETKRQVKDALALAEDAMPDIILEMIRRAQDPQDRESQRAAEYLIDRIYGRAKQSHAVGAENGLPLVIKVVYERLGQGRSDSDPDVIWDSIS